LEKILIAPVGLYLGRVLTGIKTFKPDKIYLLTMKKDKDWERVTAENAKKIKEKIGFLYEEKIVTYSIDFTSFAEIFKTVHGIIQEETKGKAEKPQFLIDVTSTTRFFQFAIANVAAVHHNVSCFYTPPSNPLQPAKYALGIIDVDHGKEPILMPVIKSMDYSRFSESRIVKDILMKLNMQKDKSVKSIATLLELIGRDPTKKRDYMLIGRKLNELEKYGYVLIKPHGKKEKEIKLTIVGEALAGTLT